MKIPSEDVPQADMLEDVIKVVEAVDAGAKSFQDLAKAIGKVERQGRYYRRAAEILGFIQNEHNRSRLTKLGRIYLDGTGVERKQLLAQSVLSSRMMLRVIPFLESRGNDGVSKGNLEKFISEVTVTTENMVQRRTMTILSWLQAVGVLHEVRSRYFVTTLPAEVKLLEFDDDDEPLFPKSYDLAEYENVARKIRERSGKIAYFVDEAKRERANNLHHHLVDLVADRIRAASAIPRQNRLIDLSASVQDEVFLFEMKSTTPDNVREQVRKGISQLYEYRYIQDVDAKLVLVLDVCPQGEEKWLVDYLVKDRKILVAWDGNDQFDCPDELKPELEFLL
jgi:hypothetical protein